MTGQRTRRSQALIELPAPRRRGPTSLEEALAGRRSIREFRDRALSRRELSQLLWALQGITSPEGDRAAPSAGGLLPLETYLGTREGFFHYQPARHRLRRLSPADPREAIYRAGLEQEPLLEAPAVFLIAALFSRTVRKYGEDDSPRYIFLEAGHAAQNLLLEAVALGLGALAVGAFYEEELIAALPLIRGHRPLYLIAAGEPRGG